MYVDLKQVVHNASVLNGVGVTGLQLYNFARTVTIPFWTETWKPTSFYDKIKVNLNFGMHTLCLLGIVFSFSLSFSVCFIFQFLWF
jgi:diphthine synthase